MQTNDISKLNDIHDLDELRVIREAHLKEAEAIKQAEIRIRQEKLDEFRRSEQKFKNTLTEEICGNHDLSYESCVRIVDRAWADHHIHGTLDVVGAAYVLANLIEQIIKNEYQCR